MNAPSTGVAASGPTAVATTVPSAQRVIVIGVPGLTFEDLTAAQAPTLAGLTKSGLLGVMSVRAATWRTCALDGWATLGAGNRARYPTPVTAQLGSLTEAADGRPAQVPAVPLAGCGRQEWLAAFGSSAIASSPERIRDDAGTASFGASPGLVATDLECVSAYGYDAAIALTSPDGGRGSDRPVEHVSDQLPSDRERLSVGLSRCPLSVISLTHLTTFGAGGDTGPRGPATAGREAQLGSLDEAVEQVDAASRALPGPTMLIVAGLSEVGEDAPSLHPLLLQHPDIAPGWMASASTGRAPYVQLIDLAPTIRLALQAGPEHSMVGAPVQRSGPREDDLARDVARALDLNALSSAQHVLAPWMSSVLVAAAGVLAAGVLLIRSSPSQQIARRIASAMPVAAAATIGIPVAALLATVVPWWRAPNQGAALVAATTTMVVVVLLVAKGLEVTWIGRRLPSPMAAAGLSIGVAATTVAIVLIDVAVGSPLQMGSMLGYNAIVAGRFTGLGNLGFALLAAGLFLTAPLTSWRTRRGRAGVVVAALTTVVLVASPALGRDFGGALALVPALAIFVLLVRGTAMSLGRLLLIATATVVTAGGFAVADFLRPDGDRTHLGRFVEQVLTGQASVVIERKARANLDVALSSHLTWMLPSIALVCVLAIWHSRRLPESARRSLRTFEHGAVAATTALVLGAVLNDSGVAVLAVGGLLVTGVAATHVGPSDEHDDAHPSRRSRHRRPRSGPTEQHAGGLFEGRPGWRDGVGPRGPDRRS